MTEITIALPTLHPGQVRAYKAMRQHKRAVARCGRRFGKTALMVTMAADAATKGFPVGVFAPDYKILSETYHELHGILDPLITQASRVDGVMRTRTGGRVDFWSLDNERAGRSRKYKLVLGDEVAFTKANMMTIWETSIEPTLLDMIGSAYFFSNTNGVKTDNFLWKICHEPRYGFYDHHAPTHENPYMSADELERIRLSKHPMIWRQEYLAEFVDFAGDAFFRIEWMLDDNMPVQYPTKCDGVFAVIDTALKDGVQHDGTAVSFYAINTLYGQPLTLLDWDIKSIEGAMLETWLPEVYARLEELARVCRANRGSLGVWIEDKVSGTVLLQKAAMNGWVARPLPNELAAAGKSGRAINVADKIYRGDLKISEYAYDKTVEFKGASQNHWITQVTSFRIGMKEGAADDLLDTMTYAVAIALGGSEGYAA